MSLMWGVIWHGVLNILAKQYHRFHHRFMLLRNLRHTLVKFDDASERIASGTSGASKKSSSGSNKSSSKSSSKSSKNKKGGSNRTNLTQPLLDEEQGLQESEEDY